MTNVAGVSSMNYPLQTSTMTGSMTPGFMLLEITWPEPFLVNVSVTNAKSSKCWWGPSPREEFCETVTTLPLDHTLKAELSFDKNRKSLSLLLIF